MLDDMDDNIRAAVGTGSRVVGTAGGIAATVAAAVPDPSNMAAAVELVALHQRPKKHSNATYAERRMERCCEVVPKLVERDLVRICEKSNS